MNLSHTFRGTKHRIELAGASPRVGAWAGLTQPAVLALSPRERVVMVTEWGRNSVFPLTSHPYLVREIKKDRKE